MSTTAGIQTRTHTKTRQLSPSVAAMVKPSPHDTLVNVFPPKGRTRTWTPWCFLKSFTPSWPYRLQPKVNRRPRSGGSESQKSASVWIHSNDLCRRKASPSAGVPSMAAVWVFPGAMLWILNLDSCFAKVSVVAKKTHWKPWCGARREKSNVNITVSLFWVF